MISVYGILLDRRFNSAGSLYEFTDVDSALTRLRKVEDHSGETLVSYSRNKWKLDLVEPEPLRNNRDGKIDAAAIYRISKK